MRPIDADRLKAVLEKNFGHTGGASVLEQLIDEQPTIEPSTNCSEIPNSSDTISRQAVIDAIDRYYKDKRYITRSRTILSAICRDMISTMDSLPSTQPELIEKTAYIRGFEQGRTQGMIDSQGGRNE